MVKYTNETTYGTCAKCISYDIGKYRYLCDHCFLCIKCIKAKTIYSISKGGINEYCKICQEPTNPKFIEVVIKYNSGMAAGKASVWRNCYLK